MGNNMEEKVKELVSDFKLDEALDVLIAQAQTQNQRKQNTLLVLKGKLALLEEQRLAGMLDADDIARQKAAIAHQILDIADGSPLDHELPQPVPEQVLVQKTVSVPASNGGMGKYLLIGGLLVVAVLAGVFFARNRGNEPGMQEPAQTERTTVPASPTEPISEETTTGPAQPSSPAGDELAVDFPNYRKKFNFLDFQYNFQEVTATQYSDTELRLIIKYILTCRNNAGSCYRAIPRILVDGNPIGPTHQKDLLGYYSSNTTIEDELTFVLPANGKEYLFELSRDGSTWKRAFKILK
ncbi:MAG: hypothetical protein MUC59_13085 [Saprospiraceae bacterium]|jgi:hypothetical protein|nr:hypothetical protein [Saprospiraceae bacterium]